MTIPKVAPYALPDELEWPKARASWQLEHRRAALLVHDAQQYFLDCYPRGDTPVEPMLQNIVGLRDTCRKLDVPIVYSAQPVTQTDAERGLLSDMWGPGITTSPQRGEIEPTLRPQPSDLRLTKWRYSAFAKTRLRDWLREQGRDQLIICGVYAHIGCQATACDAFMADIQPFVVGDAIADFSREHHVAALRYVASCVGVVVSAADAALQLQGSASRSLEAKPSSCLDSRLREALARPTASAPGPSAEVSLRQQLRREVAQLLSVEEQDVPDDVNLVELGLDSMRLMSLTERVNELGFEVDFFGLAETPTVAAWSGLLSSSAPQVQSEGA